MSTHYLYPLKLLLLIYDKGIVFFFFLIKFMGHSFNQIVKLCFFFSRSGKKKYEGAFFFSQKKFMRHSFRIWWVFLFFLKVGCVFFFSTFWVFFVCFFFSCKSSHCHSFIQSRGCIFFFLSLEKKIQLFHSFNRFFPKVWKKWTFTEKKYDTLDVYHDGMISQN